MVDLCDSVQACGTEMQKQQLISCGGYIVIKQFKNGGCDSSPRLGCGHEQESPDDTYKRPLGDKYERKRGRGVCRMSKVQFLTLQWVFWLRRKCFVLFFFPRGLCYSSSEMSSPVWLHTIPWILQQLSLFEQSLIIRRKKKTLRLQKTGFWTENCQ